MLKCVTNNDIPKFFKILNETIIFLITSANITLSVEAKSTLIASTPHEHAYKLVCMPNANGTNIQIPQESYGTNQVENDGCMDVDGKCYKKMINFFILVRST